MRPLLFATLLTIATACGPKPGAAPSDPPMASRPSPDPTAPEPIAARRDALRARLVVRHVRDLPDADALRALPGAAEDLAWIMRHDDLPVVRARAAERLGLLDPDTAAPALIALITDQTAPRLARAGAAEGLAHIGPADHAGAREALFAMLTDADALVAGAAATALAAAPALHEPLRAALLDPAVSDEVREVAADTLPAR